MDKKWIEKVRCTVDQRVCYIHLLEAGVEHMQETRAILDPCWAGQNKLTSSEADTLNKLLDKLRG
jgi:DNA-binding MarR family transcriptional regulator